MTNEILKTDDTKLSSQQDRYYTPEVDILETDKEVKCIFDLPGVEKEKIKINFDKNHLTVEAEATNYISNDWKPVSEEYRIANYKRSIAFTEVVDSTKTAAEYENGVLTVTVAKREKTKPKTIEIKVN